MLSASNEPDLRKLDFTKLDWLLNDEQRAPVAPPPARPRATGHKRKAHVLADTPPAFPVHVPCHPAHAPAPALDRAALLAEAAFALESSPQPDGPGKAVPLCPPAFSLAPFVPGGEAAAEEDDERDSAHESVEGASKSKKKRCDECGKAFEHQGDLNRHKRIHTGERPYKCSWPGCTFAFAVSSNRNRHVRTHTDSRPYVCGAASCRKSYRHKGDLTRHQRTTHAELLLSGVLNSANACIQQD